MMMQLQQLLYPLQLCAEQGVGDGLEEVIQGGYFIAVDGKLGQLGNEYDEYPVIPLPDPLCSGHAVHMGHVDIQKDQIPFRLVGVQ